MPHKTRPRHVRAIRAGRPNRSRQDAVDTTRNVPTYNVIFVWGARDMATRRVAVHDRSKALRVGKSLAEKGAQIVLIKKGTFHTGMKLIADFSTVGGA